MVPVNLVNVSRHFPRDEQGIMDGCQFVKEIIEQNKEVTEVIIQVFLDSKSDQSTGQIELKKKVLAEVTYTNLKNEEITKIQSFLSQLPIFINTTHVQGTVEKTPSGGQSVSGSVRNTMINVSDDQLRSLLGDEFESFMNAINNSK